MEGHAMRCDDAVDRIVDSLMDSLDAGQRRELEAHLAACPSCAAEAEALRNMWEGLGRLTAPAPTSRAAVALGRRLGGERPAARRAPWLRSAAAVALLLLGAAAGYALRGGGAPVNERGGPGDDSAARTGVAPTFALFVRGDTPRAPVAGPDLVREYARWAATLAEEGRLVGGNKLTDEPGRWVSSAAAETRTRSDLTGYFLITAADYDEAVRVAETSPHIAYGGTFEIRQVDRVD